MNNNKVDTSLWDSEARLHSKRVYFNKPQLITQNIAAKTTVIVAGRRTGKTDSIASPFVLRNMQRMPGSTGGIVVPTFKHGLTNTLPGLLAAWKRWGYINGVHYVVGRRPPKSFAKPITEPADYEHVITFYNGSVAVYYKEYSTLENLQLLGEEYIRQMKRDFTPKTFQTSILCQKIGISHDGFYSSMQEYHKYDASDFDYLDSLGYEKIISEAQQDLYSIHANSQFSTLHSSLDCRSDSDISPMMPLCIGMDYNANINWIVCGQPKGNRQNNDDLILAIQSAGVERGRNGFRKNKSMEKQPESEEDLLEHRTDGIDAFDTLYIGCEKFPQHDLYPICVGGVR